MTTKTIGFLVATTHHAWSQFTDAFEKQLSTTHGWQIGTDIKIEYQSASGLKDLYQSIAKDFANKFACNINVIPYDDADSMLAAINHGEASQSDLVLPPDYLVPTLLKSNALAQLRHENIPNLKKSVLLPGVGH